MFRHGCFALSLRRRFWCGAKSHWRCRLLLPVICAGLLSCPLLHAGGINWQGGLTWQYARLSLEESHRHYQLDNHGPAVSATATWNEQWFIAGSMDRQQATDNGLNYQNRGGSVSLGYLFQDGWLRLEGSRFYEDYDVQFGVLEDRHTVRQSHNDRSLSAAASRDFWLADQWLLGSHVQLGHTLSHSERRESVAIVVPGSRESGRRVISLQADDTQTGVDLGTGLSLTWLLEEQQSQRLWAPGVALDYQRILSGDLLTPPASGGLAYRWQQTGARTTTVRQQWASASVFVALLNTHWQLTSQLVMPLQTPHDQQISIGLDWFW
ncbi:hypothetical protein Q4551_03895 [Oceanobacter sp. 5_MG-2023]|uniref:hypothetical protein n=1 Tax=Oceanobacter sp. 5_MG-2023 TaxID=3062645 RepID=UPI0026E41FF9|nr:hypothetical protein [Oceanobacter sp. 5_MG-2023]MDO6681421.1 hypothetical protein [Oceanobacter sp. 5_MG-2023]